MSTGATDKLACELLIDDDDDPTAPKTTARINLASQPLHVLEEVCWGPEDGEAGVAAGAGERGDEAKGEAIGNYVDNLVPVLLSTAAQLFPARSSWVRSWRGPMKAVVDAFEPLK